MKIGPVDTEMALLILKKEEITEGKIYIPIGSFAERAKLEMRGKAWCIARSAPQCRPLARQNRATIKRTCKECM